MAEFKRLIEQSKRGSTGRDATQLVVSENTPGIFGITEYFERISVKIMLFAALMVSQIYGVCITVTLKDAKIRNVRSVLKR